MAYTDLHEHLKKLEANGLLRRVTRLINKDTELHPLVRWQYRGLTEEDRKAWLFENVTDAKGRRYNMPVVVGALAGNPAIYYLGMGCNSVEEMDAKWKKALSEPIAPVAVGNAKCQDVVHIGDELDKEGFGLDKFPVPISTPGFDNGPYTTCSHWITADPETGIQNIGNYRGHIKARRRSYPTCRCKRFRTASTNWAWPAVWRGSRSRRSSARPMTSWCRRTRRSSSKVS